MDNIKVKSLGPIKEANINFGDLTFFVGPQASGKSILLQLIKLIVDTKHIRATLLQYGFAWSKNTLDRFFGEGMSNIWNENTSIQFDNQNFTTENLNPSLKFETTANTPNITNPQEQLFNIEESLFYIPAQRIVCLEEGWPRYFKSYDDSAPYVLRHFGETLRQLLESGIEDETYEVIFPQAERLNKSLENSFNNTIFHDGKIILEQLGKKRLKLNFDNTSIPFMAWSAGQKEFMPLLLSFYYLCPASKATRKNAIKYVIIEEPEMGLHPQAISSVILQIIDLLSRDYKVIVSTHSPVLLEFAWAFNFLKKSNVSSDALFELFNLDKKNNASLSPLFKTLLEKKSLNTYYFDKTENGVSIKDISSLDAGSDDTAISEWGGLSSFSSKASDLVAKSVNSTANSNE